VDGAIDEHDQRSRFRGAILGHEGRRRRQVAASVGFSRFHEGCGAGKTDPPGGRILVNRKKIVNKKTKVSEKE